MSAVDKKLAQEAARRAKLNISKFQLRKVLFPKQQQFFCHPSKFKAGNPGRRAGKTWGALAKLIDTCLSHPNSPCAYLTSTRTKAEAIIMDTLREVREKYKLDFEINQNKMSVTFSNGSTIRCFGVDDRKQVDLIRGNWFRAAIVDEMQNIREDLLEYMLVEVLMPTLGDVGGEMLLIGTVSDINAGTWFDICHNHPNWPDFHFAKWTYEDNPHVDHKFIETQIKSKMTDTQWRREWLCEWISKDGSLIFPFGEQNKLTSQEEKEFFQLKDIITILAADAGHSPDDDAIVVLAYSPSSPFILVLAEEVYQSQGFLALGAALLPLRKRFNTLPPIVDFGGGSSKKGLEDIRIAFPELSDIQTPEKTNNYKITKLKLIESDIKIGRLKLVDATGRGARILQDAQRIRWTMDSKKQLAVGGHMPDILDALFYAYQLCFPNSSFDRPLPEPEFGSKEWAWEYWQQRLEKRNKPFWESDLERFREDDDVDLLF